MEFWKWVLPTAEAASQAGMTPIDAVPADGSNAKSMAEASGAAARGEAIGTSSGVSAEEQYQAEMLKQANLGIRQNPGAYDKAEDDAKRVLTPDIYDGFRFSVNKPHGPKFTTSFDFLLGSSMLQSGNSFHYTTTCTPTEDLFLMGRIDPSGSLDARIISNITSKLNATVIANLSSDVERSVIQLKTEYKGSDYTAGAVMTQGPYLGVSYFQSVTSKISLGGEGMYHHGQGMSHVFARAKYDDRLNVATATITSFNTLSANYLRKVSDHLNLAAEIEVSLENKQSMMNLGWEFLFRQSKVMGTISTEGVVSAQVMQMVDQGVALTFNAILDHSKDSHRFGYGIQIG